MMRAGWGAAENRAKFIVAKSSEDRAREDAEVMLAAVRDEKKTRARPRDGSARRSIHPPRPIRRRRRKYLSYLVAN